MSETSFNELITKAITDAEFRELLLSGSEAAFEGYDLSEQEIETLKDLEAELFDNPEALEERISRSAAGWGRI